jgi:hypothetical protein
VTEQKDLLYARFVIAERLRLASAPLLHALSVMRMKNASREERLRAPFTELSIDSLRHPENSTPSRRQLGQLVH